MCLVVLAGCGPPDIPETPFNNTAMIQAEKLFLTGNYSEAKMVLDPLIADTFHPQAFLLRGKCCLLSKDYVQAERDFLQAASRAEVFSQYIEAELGLGDTLYSYGEYKRCIGVYKMLLSKYGARIPRPNVMLRYAHALIRLGKRDQGQQVLDEILRLYPDSGAAGEVPELKGSSTGDFYIQLGIFSGRENAESLMRNARIRGLQPRLIQNAGGFMVIVGYFKNINRAREMLTQVKTAGFSKAFIKP